jgi:hypothetical protein
VWYCHQCQEGGSERYERKRSAKGGKPDLGDPTAVFDYHNEAGERLFQVLKFEPLNAPKKFFQRTGPDQKKWSIKGVRRVLYRLPELIEAVAADHVVFVVEGEKDVETLCARGVPATTNPMGVTTEEKQEKGTGWLPEYSKTLCGGDVVLCGDNDAPGREHMRIVATQLNGIARRVRVLDLAKFWPEIEESDDITDWFGAGGTTERLWQMVDQLAPDASPANDAQDTETKRTERHQNAPNYTKDTEIELQWDRMSDIEPEAVDWIWPGRIARGKLTLIAGDPGMGKSQIALDVAARVSKAALFPDDKRAPSGSVLILTAEDAANDTVRPRLEACDADLARVYRLRAALFKDGRRRTFSLQHDLVALGKKVQELGDVALVIVDPITSYMGSGDKIDSHRTTDVRAVLEPLADWAEKHRVAVVGITHPPKNAPAKAIHALVGSIAFSAAARLVFLVIEEADSERRLLLAVKNNHGALAAGLGYLLTQTIITKDIVASHVAWDTRPVTVTANEALRASGDDGRVTNEAKEFLRTELADGPRPATDLKKAARDAGLSWGTVQRAQQRLGIKPRKISLEGGWEWALPEHAHRQREEIERPPWD